MRIAVTGATGLVGTALVARLATLGHDVARVVRSGNAGNDISWDPASRTIDPGAFDDFDAVVHLAGAGIADHRWTDDYKRQLVESRTIGTALVAETIAGATNRPTVLLSASAIGWYGSRGDEELDETSAKGSGFLSDLCARWEAATAPAEEAGTRVVHLRTGIVLSADGGALKRQLPLFKLGLGNKLGSGKQWQSWISIDDEVGAIVHLLSSSVAGPANLTAPSPVTNARFADALGEVLRRPTFLPIPKFGPKLLLGGELADNLLFEGQRVLPRVLVADGYRFAHPEVTSALRAMLSS
jgi:uncharacterized protein